MPSLKTKLIPIAVCLFLFAHGITAFASTSDGTILSPYQYAWSNNSGWVNFGLASGAVHVRDGSLTGYAWAANHGWINLSATNGGVTNNGAGTLGGWAWGEQLGWISFAGVTIDSNGRFHGQATGTLVGILSFDCDNCNVQTDWRPVSSRGSSGGVVVVPPAPGSITTDPNLQTSTSTEPTATDTPATLPANPLDSNELPAPEKEPTPTPPTYCEMYPASEQCAGITPEFCASNPADARCQPLVALSFCDTHPDDPSCTKPSDQNSEEPKQAETSSTDTSIWDRAVSRSEAAVLAARQIRQHLAEKLQSPTQPVVTGVVTAAGAGAALAGHVAVLYAGLGGLPELNLILLRLIQNFMAVLGLRRKRRYWGTVFDSTTKQPLDPVVVELRDAKTNQRLEQAITDMTGRYGFLSREGAFTIMARKTHYRFPSQDAATQNDLTFDRLYHGEPISVGSSDVVAPNIPMDPLASDWNQQEKQRFMKFHPYRDIFLHFLFSVIFFLGFVWTALAATLTPSLPNLLCLALYLVVAMLRRLLPHERLWGRILDAKTGVVLAQAAMELRPPDLEIVVARTRSGPDGRFFLKAPPGRYRLSVYEELSDDSPSSLIKEAAVTIRKSGTLNANIGL
jgi:hypothetical protein